MSQRRFPPVSDCAGRLTLIFSYVLERKGKACVFALDDAHFSKSTFADHAQQAEVVEVHCGV
jgi:hypothetical protein